MQSSPTPPPNLQAANPPWNPIIISLVGAICTLFLFLSYYKILCRFCFNLCGILSGDRSQRRLLNEANPADDPSLQFQSRALDSVTLEMLPAIQFRKKVDDVEAGEEGADCSVCLGELEEGEWLRLLPNCAHVFHIVCINAWFRTHSNCPLCRFNVSYNYDSYHRYATSLFATLSREDVHGERAVDYWDFGSGNSLNPGRWCREIDSISFNREFWAGVNSPSLIAALRYQQNVGYLRKEDQDLRASSSWIEGDCENQSS